MSGAPDLGGRTGPVVFLMGPTGAGKTALALGLAARLPVGLVSVDSAMIYRGLDIGTDKPGATVLARFPHRLIDIRDVDQAYSAAEFRRDALSAIRDLLARGRIPLLVGGTGLYFRALEHGLSALPGAHRGVRERLSSEARSGGWARLHRRLAVLDPEAAARIHPHDAQRIQRALEVCEVTGDPLTALFARDTQEPLPYGVIKLVIAPRDRERLHAGQRQRFLGMLERGLIDEVRRVLGGTDARDAWPAMRLVGYRQVFEHLTGRWDRNALVERAVIATRQLAKRQMTWLRAERGAVRLDSDDPCLLSKALAWLADEPPTPSRCTPPRPSGTAQQDVLVNRGGALGRCPEQRPGHGSNSLDAPEIEYNSGAGVSSARGAHGSLPGGSGGIVATWRGCWRVRDRHTAWDPAPKNSKTKRAGVFFMSKGQSLQEPFLNALRREHVPVSIYLVNGIKLQGQIESFDQFVVLLKNSVSQMVYKHAISTIVPSRNIKLPREDGEGEEAQPYP